MSDETKGENGKQAPPPEIAGMPPDEVEFAFVVARRLGGGYAVGPIPRLTMVAPDGTEAPFPTGGPYDQIAAFAALDALLRAQVAIGVQARAVPRVTLAGMAPGPFGVVRGERNT